MDKLFIQADELLSDSFKLAWKVYESGYRPNYIIGVWRGGAPIGIAVQEFLDVLGVPSDHIAIRTSHYKGWEIETARSKCMVLTILLNRLNQKIHF
jgi:hypoxanthine phosphoribosyltransferase